MSDSRSISGTVNVQTVDSQYRVAFELMEKISQWEPEHTKKDNREYWLTLYYQCRKATYASSLESTLKVS